MDTVTVNGKIYKKATVLAKQFRYTTDYIGQLCRNKKVDCQFVGRSWYVTEASLLAHKDTRYKEVRVDEKTIKNSHISVRDTSEISVRPRLLKTAQKAAPASHFASRLIPRESKYFTDETELLPVAVKPAPAIKPIIPTTIPVALEAATTIKVKAEKAIEKLDFTDLPTVALTGNLVVQEIVPDETPSTPVVLPVPAMAKAKPEASHHEVKTVLVQPPVDNKISFTPTQVRALPKPAPRYFLLATSILTSCLLFGFVTTANVVFTIGKNITVKQVQFDAAPLQNLLTESR